MLALGAFPLVWFLSQAILFRELTEIVSRNVLVVIGITSSILPINGIDKSIINNDMLWVLLFSVIILPLAYLGKKNVLTRKKGIMLLVLYLIFIIPLLI